MLTPDAFRSLKTVIDSKRIITDPAELVVYEIDATQSGIPDAVVFPKNVAEIVKLVCWAAEQHVPIVAHGAGTGLSGGTVPDHGGIVVEFSMLDRILALDTAGRSVSVEPGVVNLVLDGFVKAQGLYFPPDPASGRSSTIGGNIAENAGGPHCFKYGVMANYVTGLQAVLSDGRTVQFGGRAYDYPGYDLAALVTGSEGTLALITRLDARLIRNLPGVKTMMAAFDSVEAAGKAVSAFIAAGLLPATMELMDQRIMRIVEDFVHAGLPVDYGAMLIIEVDGFPTSLDPQVDEIVRILEQHQAHQVRIAQTAEESAKIWYGRKSAAGCMAKLAPAYFLVDGTVPRSRLAETLDAIDRICARLDLKVGYLAHAGDGNLHPMIPYFPSDPDQVVRGGQACAEIMQTVVAHDGSLTGEHGIGLEKREYMPLMFDGAELDAMRDVKKVFDPDDLLNPGKVFPSTMPPISRAAPLPALAADVIAPRTASETAAVLAACAQARRNVVVNRMRRDTLTLSTRELTGILRYAPDDLYITVGAGTPLVEVQAFLAKDGRQVPLVSPWQETTAGAIVNVNLNSPQRMRYGAVRDLLLACTVALPDGRVVRAGRAVVKNVAGYDLPKVFVGAYGTLGVVTDATFKLLPLPRAQRTLSVPAPDLEHALAWGSRLLRVAAMASAIVVTHDVAVVGSTSPYTLTYTVEGMAEDVQAELDEARQALEDTHASAALESAAPTGTALWCRLLQSATPQSMNVRIGVPPDAVAAYVRHQAPVLESGAYLVDVPSGMVYAVSTPETAATATAWLQSLREPARAAGGYAIATFVPPAWRADVDRWGFVPEALDLIRGLKTRWDPQNILGPGEFLL